MSLDDARIGSSKVQGFHLIISHGQHYFRKVLISQPLIVRFKKFFFCQTQKTQLYQICTRY